jgi:2-dehydropantoate 2-reductase
VKILVLGAGAVGGYFGGRLAEQGSDVTFLIREQRRDLLREQGLRVQSVHGDFTAWPQLIVSGEQASAFDVVLLTSKAYHLEESIAAIRPYVGEQTVIIPLLNGIAHIARLQAEFGPERVLGGLCYIESTLREDGVVVQTSPMHEVVFGQLTAASSERIARIQELFSGTQASFRLSENIDRDMWHKYLFITVFSGVTTLVRSAIGPIREAVYGKEIIQQLFAEVAAIIRAEGAPIDVDIEAKQWKVISKQKATMKSSMLRDMEKGGAIEVDHLQGYLLQLAEKYEIESNLLQTVYHNLKVYESNR